MVTRGQKLDNGTWTDLLQKIQNEECDFAVGGFYPDNEVHEDFAVTSTYYQDSFKW